MKIVWGFASLALLCQSEFLFAERNDAATMAQTLADTGAADQMNKAIAKAKEAKEYDEKDEEEKKKKAIEDAKTYLNEAKKFNENSASQALARKASEDDPGVAEVPKLERAKSTAQAEMRDWQVPDEKIPEPVTAKDLAGAQPSKESSLSRQGASTASTQAKADLVSPDELIKAGESLKQPAVEAADMADKLAVGSQATEGVSGFMSNLKGFLAPDESIQAEAAKVAAAEGMPKKAAWEVAYDMHRSLKDPDITAGIADAAEDLAVSGFGGNENNAVGSPAYWRNKQVATEVLRNYATGKTMSYKEMVEAYGTAQTEKYLAKKLQTVQSLGFNITPQELVAGWSGPSGANYSNQVIAGK